MFTIKENPDKIVELTIDGEIDTHAMKIGLDQLLEIFENRKHGRLFYRIVNFKMPGLSALMVEFNRLPRLMSLIGKIDRAAVVTDENWIAKAARIEGALIPGLEIRTFTLEEEDAAFAYLQSE